MASAELDHMIALNLWLDVHRLGFSLRVDGERLLIHHPNSDHLRQFHMVHGHQVVVDKYTEYLIGYVRQSDGSFDQWVEDESRWIEGQSCGGEHDARCDGPDGHYALFNRAVHDGFPEPVSMWPDSGTWALWLACGYRWSNVEKVRRALGGLYVDADPLLRRN